MTNYINYEQSFKYFTQEVINWNEAAGNAKHTTRQYAETQLLNQMSFARSEIEETLNAIFDHDKKEIVDGICDTFVTVSYYCHLTGMCTLYDNDLSSSYTTNYKPYLLPTNLAQLYPQLLQLHNDMQQMNSFHVLEKLYLLMCSFVNICSGDIAKVDWFMQKVIDSNNSKFVPLQDYLDDKESHEQFVQQKYKDKFENIIPVRTILGNKEVVVFRADNGSGKILKPKTFIEPNISQEAKTLQL